eukprot:PhM_4_TR12890/c0_g1_i1/m.88256
MGIPKFARWISSRYRRGVLKEYPDDVEGLLVDMNGIIHPACHSDGTPLEGGEEEMIRRVVDKTNSLIEEAHATGLVYLAMDGVAPRAKMKQQRIRRYMSALAHFGVEEGDIMFEEEDHDDAGGRGGGVDLDDLKEQTDDDDDDHGIMRDDEDNNDRETDEEGDDEDEEMRALRAELDLGVLQAPKNTFKVTTPASTIPPVTQQAAIDARGFDDNCISPGTEFMEKVAKALEVQCETVWTKKYPGVAFVVSSTQDPGEGEHKLIDHLRTYAKSTKGSYVIHGNDADLILLCLLLHNCHTYIVKEQTWGTRVMTDIFNVDEIRRGLARDMTKRIHKLNPGLAMSAPPSLSPIGLVEDFVFLATLVGNDFLPHLPSAFVAEYTIDNIMEMYAHSFLPMGGFITQVTGIHVPRLMTFFDMFSRMETSLFRFRLMLQKKLTESELRGAPGSPQDAAWRETYYKSVRLDPDSSVSVAQRYVEGLRWVWGYYTIRDCTHWTWSYPHSHAPLTADIVAAYRSNPSLFLGSTSKADGVVRFPASDVGPLDPLEQLVCVLPPTSAALLPNPIRQIMTSSSSSLSACFPTHWDVDYTGADRDYQATIMFPELDAEVLLSTVRDVLASLTSEEARRNTNRPLSEPGALFGGDRADVFGQIDVETNVRRHESRKQCEDAVGPFKARTAKLHNRLSRALQYKVSMATAVPICALSAVAGFLVAAAERPSLTSLVGCAYTVLTAYGVSGTWCTERKRPSYDGVKPKEVYRDWLCTKCCVRNFAVNTECFMCGSEWTSTSAPVVLSLMHAISSHFDIDHAPNIHRCRMTK